MPAKNYVTRVFTHEEIMEAVLAEIRKDDPDITPEQASSWAVDYLLESDYVGMDKFEAVREFVLTTADEKHWKIRFESNNGAGYNDFFGTRWEFSIWDENWKYNPDCAEVTKFTATQVREVTKTIVTYEPVEVEGD